MSPTAVEVPTAVPVKAEIRTKALHHEPLKLSGSLDAFEQFDLTPIIGREFPTANLVDWLNSPNSDNLLRDLAITSETSSCLNRAVTLTLCSLSARRRLLQSPE
jgi:hypothetical protein